MRQMIEQDEHRLREVLQLPPHRDATGREIGPGLMPPNVLQSYYHFRYWNDRLHEGPTALSREMLCAVIVHSGFIGTVAETHHAGATLEAPVPRKKALIGEPS